MATGRYELQKLKRTVPPFVGDFAWPQAWIIDGTEVSSGAPLNVLYVGSETEKNYIAYLAFDGNCKQTYVGRQCLGSLRRLVSQRNFDASLVVVEGHSLHRNICADEGDFYVPLWLEGAGDIPLVAQNRSAKEDLRRIRKNRLQYAVTRDLDQFRRFYYDMYLPYVTERHGDRTTAVDCDDLTEMARRRACELLLVQKDSESIAGMVILFPQNLPRLWATFLGAHLPRLWAIGLKNGDVAYAKDGAVAATYLFSSLYLGDRGYPRMHMGLSRAFLYDGVLRYKTKWGMRIVGHYALGFLLKPLSWSPGVRGFLVHNPFAFVDKGQLCAAIFLEGDTLASDWTSEKLQADLWLNGLSRLDLYACSQAGIQLSGTVCGDA